jgi:GNAT superfamily N-acetyltransferase
MTVRRVTPEELDAFRELWEEFHQAPAWVRETWETVLPYVKRSLSDGLLLVAADAERLVGFLWAEVALTDPASGRLVDLYVRPDARRRGLARALIRAAGARLDELGATRIAVEVFPGSEPAMALYERLGFAPHTVNLLTTVDELVRAPGDPGGRSFGSIHVQTDDLGAVERAVEQFVPRLEGSSAGTAVVPPRNGWIAVYDDLCDRDPVALRRLARELSDRLGGVVVALGVESGAVVRFVLLERGRVMDEYLSVPEFYGPLPPGDVIALRANPTVVARLTGADPAAVRAAARTASAAADLPRAEELLAGISRALGIEGGEHGYTAPA